MFIKTQCFGSFLGDVLFLWRHCVSWHARARCSSPLTKAVLVMAPHHMDKLITEQEQRTNKHQLLFFFISPSNVFLIFEEHKSIPYAITFAISIMASSSWPGTISAWFMSASAGKRKLYVDQMRWHFKDFFFKQIYENSSMFSLGDLSPDSALCEMHYVVMDRIQA